MNVKKFLPTVSLVAFMAITSPASSSNITPVSSPMSNPATTTDPTGQQLLQRLEDIKAMDKSEMTGSEKKDLRKEVKGIRKEMKTIRGGVYLSAGAIIIVILLLILIL